MRIPPYASWHTGEMMGIFGKSQTDKWQEAASKSVDLINGAFGPYFQEGRLERAIMTDPFVAGYIQARLGGLVVLVCSNYPLPQSDVRPVLGIVLQTVYGNCAHEITYATKAFAAERSAEYVRGFSIGNDITGYLCGRKDVKADSNYAAAVQLCEMDEKLKHARHQEDRDLNVVIALEQLIFGNHMQQHQI